VGSASDLYDNALAGLYKAEVWAHFEGENASLFLEASTLEELEWVIERQVNYAGCERRHSRLAYRSPVEYLISEGFIPETLVESRGKSGST